MISKDKTYRTRDGREVRIYAVDGDDWFPIHGAYKEKNGWYTCAWSKDGFYLDSTTEHRCDLIEVKPRHQRTLWMNMYLDYPDMRGHVSEAAADQAARDDRIACIKIDLDFEEGEGL